MKRLLLFGLLFAGSFIASSSVMARAGGGGYIHSSAPARSVSTFRASPIVRSAPVYRTMPARVYAPRQYVQPNPVIHIGPVHTMQRAAFAPRNPILANPVRLAPERFVRFRGGTIGLPALTALSAPIILDLPELGEIVVPQETYVTVYPLLISESEADRDLAFTMLREQAEQNPDSRVAAASPQALPTAAAPPPAPATPTSYMKGRAALDRGDFDAAIAEFTAAITDDPKDTFSYIRRASAYEEKGETASAIADYRQVLKLVDADIGAPYMAKIRRLEKTKK
ncbi:tetratricopeptide repeat protein [Bradyrhizobium sp. DASA03120]|uniref:tetratricopeptide repeat protein n=1 Tax=Bradyrhizobium sp. SMVTL-02 TaxID=3395917 RepID=UPI003F6E5AFC